MFCGLTLTPRNPRRFPWMPTCFLPAFLLLAACWEKRTAPVSSGFPQRPHFYHLVTKTTITCCKALRLPAIWLTELVLNHYRSFNPTWCPKYTLKCQHHRWQLPSPGWLHGNLLDMLFFQVVSGNNRVGSVLLSVKHEHRQLSAGSWQ